MQILFATRRRCWQKGSEPAAIALVTLRVSAMHLNAIGIAEDRRNFGREHNDGYIFTFVQRNQTRLQKFHPDGLKVAELRGAVRPGLHHNLGNRH